MIPNGIGILPVHPLFAPGKCGHDPKTTNCAWCSRSTPGEVFGIALGTKYENSTPSWSYYFITKGNSLKDELCLHFASRDKAAKMAARLNRNHRRPSVSKGWTRTGDGIIGKGAE